MNVTAIIAAAGRSDRFAPGTAKNKIEQDLGGRPVFMRSLETLANRPEVQTILLAVSPEHLDEFKFRHGDAVAIRGARVVAGGLVARWETVKNALAEVPDKTSHIAIHDGARPCLTDELVERMFEAAKLFDAVVPGVAIASTLKRVSAEEQTAVEDDAIASAILGDAGSGKSKARQVVETIPRGNLVAVQTPQIFTVELLRRAYEQDDLSSTDDASLVERLGEPVHVVEGDPCNIKITTEVDLKMARDILGVRSDKGRAAHLRF